MRVKWQYVLIKKFLIERKNPFIKLQLRTIQRTHGMMRHLTRLTYTVSYLSLTSLVIKFTKPCRFEINITSLPQYPAKKVENSWILRPLLYLCFYKIPPTDAVVLLIKNRLLLYTGISEYQFFQRHKSFLYEVLYKWLMIMNNKEAS